MNLFFIALVFVSIKKITSVILPLDHPWPISVSSKSKSLSAVNFQEGPCKEEIPFPNINVTWFGQPQVFYITAGSMFQYLSYAHVLLQKDPVTSDELKAIRPVNPFENGISKVFSYGKVFTQSCTPTDEKLSHYVCYPIANNTNVNVNGIAKENATIVMTDNKSYALITRCIDDKYRDYQLVTTEPKTDIISLSNIMSQVKQLGFNLKYFKSIIFC